MNKVILAGRIANNIQLKKYDEGKYLVRLTLAINNGKDREADFIPITAFGRAAEIIDRYANKGDSILVEGRLKEDRYEKDGEKIYRLSVVANSVELMERKHKEAEIGSEWKEVDTQEVFED